MTITTLINAQTVGGNASSTTAGYIIQPKKATLAATTTVIGIAASLTNGAAAGNPNKRVVIYAAVTPFSALTTTTGPQQLAKQAKVFEVVPDDAPAGIRIEESGPIAALGDTLILWCEVPHLNADATLTVTLIEL
jgi:hypothetical protein